MIRREMRLAKQTLAIYNANISYKSPKSITIITLWRFITDQKRILSKSILDFIKNKRVVCRPHFVTTICSFEFHVTGSGVEAVRDAPLLSLKLL